MDDFRQASYINLVPIVSCQLSSSHDLLKLNARSRGGPCFFPASLAVPAVQQKVKLEQSVTQTNQRDGPMIITESEPQPDENESVPETSESDP